MTNETATAACDVTKTVCNEFNQQLGQGQELLQQALTWLTDKGLSFAVSLLAALVILVLGSFVIKGIVALVGKAVAKSGKGNALFANFIRNVTAKICWIVLLVVVLEKLGVNVAPIVAGLGVTGFILGFAFQESLGNLASGLMIAINEPFKIGDYVIVAGHEGSVIKVDMMAATLATADNKKVVIPNKSAWGAPIVNFSALGKRRVDLQVAIGYTADLDKALKIAVEAIKAVPGVLPDPAPCVSVDALSDGRVTLNVRPWSTCDDYWTIYDASYRAVKAALEKNGINIPIPAVAVHTK